MDVVLFVYFSQKIDSSQSITRSSFFPSRPSPRFSLVFQDCLPLRCLLNHQICVHNTVSSPNLILLHVLVLLEKKRDRPFLPRPHFSHPTPPPPSRPSSTSHHRRLHRLTTPPRGLRTMTFLGVAVISNEKKNRRTFLV